jgi:hypothetical protein
MKQKKNTLTLRLLERECVSQPCEAKNNPRTPSNPASFPPHACTLDINWKRREKLWTLICHFKHSLVQSAFTQSKVTTIDIPQQKGRMLRLSRLRNDVVVTQNPYLALWLMAITNE